MSRDAHTLFDRDGWRWTVAPAGAWTERADELRWTCGADTDFWRVTQGHPSKHDGQAYLTAIDGDFVFEATFDAQLDAQFDQVGIMLERDEETWVKAGVELDGERWLSAVHTRGASDWSREPVGGLPLRLRAERTDGTVVFAVLEGDEWRTFRVLTLAGRIGVGPYSCAPRGPGFEGRMEAAVLRARADR